MLTLRPYQETAADFIYSRDRSLILAPAVPVVRWIGERINQVEAIK